MDRFFATQVVEWTATMPNANVPLFRKALKEFGITLFEIEQCKNNSTRVVYHCVCNQLLRIGIEYGALLEEERHEKEAATSYVISLLTNNY